MLFDIIHIVPYDVIGYMRHWFVSMVIFGIVLVLCERRYIQNVFDLAGGKKLYVEKSMKEIVKLSFIVVLVLSLLKEFYDLYDYGRCDIWDILFGLVGVVTGRGLIAILRDKNEFNSWSY